MTSELWTDAFLDGMREVGDPPADAAIAEIFARGDVAAVNQLLDTLTQNDDLPSADLPTAVRAYLAESAGFPPFAPAAVAAAQDLFARRGPEILSILGFYALPTAYAARKGVQVLHRTGYLAKRPFRRVLETVQMVVDVLSPGGLAPDGRGVVTAQKVRLMHAAIRHILTHDPAHPWPSELGVPINQEDLAGTLMVFSCLVLAGFPRLGIELTATEQESYLEIWTGVGRILGLRAELLPADVAEARELTQRIYQRQIESSPEGRDMLEALLEGYDKLVPSGPLSGAPRSLIHYFLDEEPITRRNIAHLLGLDDTGHAQELIRAAIGLLRLVNVVLDSNATHVGEVVRQLGLATTKAILLVERGGSRAPFHVPDGLQDGWWTRSQGEDKPLASAHNLAGITSRITGILAHSARDLVTSAVVSLAPRWNAVGRWRDMLFASWPLPEQAIRPLVPRELDLDLFEDQAWLTLVPMRMEDVHWQDAPAITSTSTMTELNLRTYVRRGDRRGVYFLSVDLDSAWIALAGSALLDLPTALARMSFDRQGEHMRFKSERIQPGAVSARLVCDYRLTGAPVAVAPGTLHAFLIERSSMFFAQDGRVRRGDIWHEPWLVAPVEATLSVNTLAAAAGLVLPNCAPHLMYAEGSDTVVMPLEDDD